MNGFYRSGYFREDWKVRQKFLIKSQGVAMSERKG